MNNPNNIILNTDSYKYSQYCQYPSGTDRVFSYIESRGGKYPETVFFGLQMFLKQYLAKPITREDIDEAEEVVNLHGIPFYREGWEYILDAHGGFLPVHIKAIPEGSVIPVKNVLATIENTDTRCFWLTSFLETALLRAIWYPTTVATNSYNSKKLILKYLIRNGDPNLIDFKLNDFGARGVSSLESAGIGGLAHLVNFKGTDTLTALMYGQKFYGEKMAGFSIPAMEHSTVTSWGEDKEVESFRNMLSIYGKPGSLLACVSDSYDIYRACENWGTVLKEQVIESGATLVIRPDSGLPTEVIPHCLQILDTHFGSVRNSKGYKLLNHVRLIQGDGIDHEMIDRILYVMETRGYSADNIAFGQGGGLLQHVNRDTQKFAMKCSAVHIKNEGWRDVFKDPITDPGKTSKKGRLQLVVNSDGVYETVREEKWMYNHYPVKALLTPVYENGELLRDQSFQEIREIANRSLHKIS